MLVTGTEGEIYTLGEFAGLCKVHVTTVRRWIAAGRLQVIRLPGGGYRIPGDEVSRIRQPFHVIRS